MSTCAEWEAFLPVTVYAHLDAGTALSHRLGVDRGHAVLHLDGTNSVQVALFAARADLVRLHDAVGAALTTLDAQTSTGVAESSTAG